MKDVELIKAVLLANGFSVSELSEYPIIANGNDQEFLLQFGEKVEYSDSPQTSRYSGLSRLQRMAVRSMSRTYNKFALEE